jgi:hypothetical protein
MSCMVADSGKYPLVFLSCWYLINWCCGAWMEVRRYGGKLKLSTFRTKLQTFDQVGEKV